jgi:protein-S-isoprenylcysteine O-methyltransferase Ste14
LFPLFFTDPAALGIFMIVCLVWVVPESIAMPRQMARAARKTELIQDRGSLILLLGLQWSGVFLDFLLAFLFPAAALPWQPALIFGFGVLLMLLGTAMRWVAIRTLGRYFTRDVAVSAGQPVVQYGLYRFIRHPAYSGTFLTMLGLGLAVGNWAGLVVLLLCVFSGHFYRVKIEEQALVRTLGQPYIDYRARTRRFIPFVF